VPRDRSTASSVWSASSDLPIGPWPTRALHRFWGIVRQGRRGGLPGSLPTVVSSFPSRHDSRHDKAFTSTDDAAPTSPALAHEVTGSQMQSLNPNGLSARPLALRGLRPAGAPSRSTTSSSAPREARTSISTGWWPSIRPAMPKPMPPTRAAGWSSPRAAPGDSPARSPVGLISGRSAPSRKLSMARALGAPRS
jgi:hypothetical protein